MSYLVVASTSVPSNEPNCHFHLYWTDVISVTGIIMVVICGLVMVKVCGK